jgi:hypothetical protein
MPSQSYVILRAWLEMELKLVACREARLIVEIAGGDHAAIVVK